MSLPAAFPAPSVYLDTNIIIYAFEAGNRWSELLRPLFRQIEDDQTTAFTSELTLAEVLVRPYVEDAADLIDLFESVLAGDGKIRCILVDRAILRSSARLKSKARLKLADSIHVATALAADARWFLPPSLAGISIDQLDA